MNAPRLRRRGFALAKSSTRSAMSPRNRYLGLLVTDVPHSPRFVGINPSIASPLARHIASLWAQPCEVGHEGSPLPQASVGKPRPASRNAHAWLRLRPVAFGGCRQATDLPHVHVRVPISRGRSRFLRLRGRAPRAPA